MVSWLRATPPRPAMPEPSPKVRESTQSVRMPMEEAMARFCVTARICRPKEVKRRSRINAANTSRLNRMI